ncbi:MAG: C4-type zinc ribbon domain-containing protein [candidate division NC10 bacterium]
MDQQLQVLINVQALDTKIAALESEQARLPGQIEAVQAAVAQARDGVQTLKGRLDQNKKDTRAKEKDLEDAQVKRQKSEARLYEVKTNKEYSAVLVEIEEIKQEKAKIEEEVLSLMEMQERVAVAIRDAEASLKTGESQGREEEAQIRQRLAAVETELRGLKGERESLSRDLPKDLLADYEKLLRPRGGLAVARVLPVDGGSICGGCRMTLTPQCLQEVKQQSALLNCESCGRFLYWLP